MQEKLTVDKYSSVRAKKVEWLWYPYIAYGKVTLLQGDPGDGKSTFMLQLAALLTSGKSLPDGSRTKRPINVLYQCEEDSPEDTIKPRLMAAGADCDRMLFFGEQHVTLDDGRLESVIMESNIKLLIFDPIQSFIPTGADMSSAGKMRSVLNVLVQTAEKTKCAVVLISHMTKDNAGKNLYRALGSIDIAAVARSILMVSRDEENPEIRYMSQIKNNLGPEGLDLSFSLSAESGFAWGSLEEHKERTRVIATSERAVKMLAALLKTGDMKSADIYEHMELLDVSERTLQRVKKQLHVETYKKGNAWYWHLPDDVADE